MLRIGLKRAVTVYDSNEGRGSVLKADFFVGKLSWPSEKGVSELGVRVCRYARVVEKV